MQVTKETVVKADGRLLVYYWFNRKTDEKTENSSDKSSATTPTDH